jgi:hypothetical protein
MGMTKIAFDDFLRNHQKFFDHAGSERKNMNRKLNV